MNHFEYGFFNELEKIATDRDAVAERMAGYRRMYPNASRADIGARATGLTQFARGTASRLSSENPSDPRFSKDNARRSLFNTTIPIPGVTQLGENVDQDGQPRQVANREQREKKVSRLDTVFDQSDRMNPRDLSRRTYVNDAGQRKQLYKPFGLEGAPNPIPYPQPQGGAQ